MFLDLAGTLYCLARDHSNSYPEIAENCSSGSSGLLVNSLGKVAPDCSNFLLFVVGCSWTGCTVGVGEVAGLGSLACCPGGDHFDCSLVGLAESWTAGTAGSERTGRGWTDLGVCCSFRAGCCLLRGFGWRSVTYIINKDTSKCIKYHEIHVNIKFSNKWRILLICIDDMIIYYSL